MISSPLPGQPVTPLGVVPVYEFTMPKMGLTMESGRILQWLKAVGDRVEKGELLVELETDKASLEVESPVAGVVQELVCPEGEEVQVGTLIARIAADGASTVPADRAPAAPAGRPHRVRASPVVRRMAREQGLDLTQIRGSGPAGQIVLKDITPPGLAAPASAAAALAPAPAAPPAPAPAATAAPPPGTPGPDSLWEPLTPLRRATVRQMILAAQVPQFRVTMKAGVSQLEELRRTLNPMVGGEHARLSLTDFLVQACAAALREHPRVNASYAATEDSQPAGVWLHRRVHVGVAVAVPGGGLRVPVIADTDGLSLLEIARRRADLVERARQGRLQPEEMACATFTVSNLGPQGVDSFDAIVNPPQAAILAVGRVIPPGELNCTLTSDHRVVDGAEAAAFLAAVVGRLQSNTGWRLV